MSLSAHETALLNFGRDVLQWLTLDTDWNADTLSSIQDNAIAQGLARADERGYFEAIPVDEFGK